MQWLSSWSSLLLVRWMPMSLHGGSPSFVITHFRVCVFLYFVCCCQLLGVMTSRRLVAEGGRTMNWNYEWFDLRGIICFIIFQESKSNNCIAHGMSESIKAPLQTNTHPQFTVLGLNASRFVAQLLLPLFAFAIRCFACCISFRLFSPENDQTPSWTRIVASFCLQAEERIILDYCHNATWPSFHQPLLFVE